MLDVGQVQDRVPDPQVTQVSPLTWDTVTIPQAALPMTIGGHRYLFEVDEFATTDDMRTTSNGPKVGAARIIDVQDEKAPTVVSDLRLQVHQRAVRPSLADDPGATDVGAGYAGHYCAIPRRADPGIVACSFLASGLRVFDIRDPRAPREVAYHVAPVPPGGAANKTYSSPAFVPERGEVWYADAVRGFTALRLTNGVWPRRRPQRPARRRPLPRRRLRRRPPRRPPAVATARRTVPGHRAGPAARPQRPGPARRGRPRAPPGLILGRPPDSEAGPGSGQRGRARLRKTRPGLRTGPGPLAQPPADCPAVDRASRVVAAPRRSGPAVDVGVAADAARAASTSG